ncbi:MAG: hypothetical protein LUE24_12065 [Lachnospiraceae bacterium]|nr:hypothetical protein [Lachnospiraceae bacterium]
MERTMSHERTYKMMGQVGGGTLALGIIVLVTGIVTGVLLIVNAARTLRGRNELLF